MTSLSIAELFKIDNRYFGTDWTTLSTKFPSVDLSVVPAVKESSVAIGIEVEMENFNNSAGTLTGVHTTFWMFKPDGSLRNNGMEAVSIPVQGEWIRTALKTLWAVIKDVSFSARTSIHIHLDVRALTQKQLTCLLLVYLSVESLLYKFVGKDRHDSIYCVPLYTTTLVNALVDFVNKSIYKHGFAQNRYAGLNLDALKKFGTLEFRQLHGTHDLNKIMTWINLIFKIYQFAMKHQLDELIQRIAALNTNSFYIAYINDVFGEMTNQLDLLDIKSDLEKGVKAVKQSMISNKFASELRKGFSKRSPAAKMYVKLNRRGDYVDSFFHEEGTL